MLSGSIRPGRVSLGFPPVTIRKDGTNSQFSNSWNYEMADIQLGHDGERHSGGGIKVEVLVFSEAQKQPAILKIYCSWLKDAGQRNFPVIITVDRREALKLVASLASALAQDQPDPQPSRANYEHHIA